MDKKYRINAKINGNDNVISVNLQQNVNLLEILSLKIKTTDAYKLHTSDYGVIVGRVLANDAFGVPNVKVSVFIPLSSEDMDNQAIKKAYPYKNAFSKDENNKRYNLLSDKGYVGMDGEHKSVGSFPNKRLVLDNDGEIEIFEKYWKYTTTTNKSGDYMLFGIPVGNCEVHYDCDLSDIGIISQKPYDMIYHGYDSNLFNSPTSFKTSNDLDSLPNIISQNSIVYVYPFWGDKSVNQIGITRNDFNLNYKFEPTCIFLGSTITDPSGSYFGVNGVPTGNNGRFASLITTSGNIEVIRYNEYGNIEQLQSDSVNIIDGNGVWCYQIPMNLDRIITNENGEIVPSYKQGVGIPTRARVRFRVTLNRNDNNVAKILIPNNPKLKPGSNNNPTLDIGTNINLDEFYEFGTKTPDQCFRDLYYGKVYSVKQYYPRIQYGPNSCLNVNNEKDYYDATIYPPTFSKPFSCIKSIDNLSGVNIFPYNTMYSGCELKSDSTSFLFFLNNLTDTSTGSYESRSLYFCFENDWVNGCMYFPAFATISLGNGEYDYYGRKNDEEIGGYNNMYYTGRHENIFNNNEFKTHNGYINKLEGVDSSDKTISVVDNYYTSRFSQIQLRLGIIKRHTSPSGSKVFYYRCGGMYMNTYYQMYATDIVLLGNMSDVFDSLPKLQNSLPSTSAFIPPIGAMKDASEAGMNMNPDFEKVSEMWHKDINDASGEDIDSNLMTLDTSSAYYNALREEIPYWSYEKYDGYTYDGADIEMEYRLGLFFGIKIRHTYDFLHYLPKSFVNLSRICELDVENNKAKKLLSDNHTFVAVNGIISRNDIVSNERRSSFASMNLDVNGYYIDEKLKHKRFKPSTLYLVDFDGRLHDYCLERGYKYFDEVIDESYVKFRYGDSTPMRYTKSYVGIDTKKMNEDLLLPVNSLYFYFGLHSGYSAIDKFKEKYNLISNDDAVVTNSILIKNIVRSSVDQSSGGFTVEIFSVLTAPYTYYLYSNGKLVKSGTIDESEYVFRNLSARNYTLKIVDSLNHVAEENVTILPQRFILYYSVYDLNGEYNKYNENVFGSIFLQKINDSNITRVTTVDDKFELTTSNNETFTMMLNVTPTVSIDINKNYIELNGTSIKCHCPASIKINLYSSNSLVLTSSCVINDGYNMYIYVNNCPADELNGWSGVTSTTTSNRPTADTKSYYWNSVETLNPNMYFTKNALQKLKYISEMAKSVYNGNTMDIFCSNTNNSYDLIATYQIMLDDTYGKKEFYNFNWKEINNINKLYRINWLGYAKNNINNPSLVGSNFPISADTKTCISVKNPASNTEYYNSPVYGAESGYLLLLREENGEIATSLPGNNEYLARRYFNQTDTLSVTELNCFFKIQTIDTRFDYDLKMITPFLSCDSGNNIIADGSFNGTIYGGFVIHHNGDVLTEYTIENNELLRSETGDFKYYSYDIHEDDGNLWPERYPEKSNNNILKIDFNNVELSGKTELSINIADCSTDFGDRRVKIGNNLALNMSYNNSISIINQPKILSGYNVIPNITYKKFGNNNNADIYYATTDDCVIEYEVNADERYLGNTYTYYKNIYDGSKYDRTKSTQAINTLDALRSTVPGNTDDEISANISGSTEVDSSTSSAGIEYGTEGGSNTNTSSDNEGANLSGSTIVSSGETSSDKDIVLNEDNFGGDNIGQFAQVIGGVGGEYSIKSSSNDLADDIYHFSDAIIGYIETNDKNIATIHNVYESNSVMAIRKNTDGVIPYVYTSNVLFTNEEGAPLSDSSVKDICYFSSTLRGSKAYRTEGGPGYNEGYESDDEANIPSEPPSTDYGYIVLSGYTKSKEEVYIDNMMIYIPKIKLYSENSSTQLKQAVVQTMGRCYYCGKIEVIVSDRTFEVHLLAKNVNKNELGKVSSYYAANATVKYDDANCIFTVVSNSDYTDDIELLYSIENGFVYKIILTDSSKK